MRINWVQSLLTNSTKKQRVLNKECAALSASCSSSRIEVAVEVEVKVAIKDSLLLLFFFFYPSFFFSSSIRHHNSQSSFPSSSSLLPLRKVVRSLSTQRMITATYYAINRAMGEAKIPCEEFAGRVNTSSISYNNVDNNIIIIKK